MNFITSKPSIPVGTAIPEFPAVLKALHTDHRCEVYLLEVTEQSSLILLCAPYLNQTAVAISERQMQWWSKLGSERVFVKKVLKESVTGTPRFEAVLQVAGEWMGARTDSSLQEAELCALMAALTELGVDASADMLAPVLLPSLLWRYFARGTTQISSVFVVPWTEDDKTRLIHQIGSTVYWLATGINPIVTAGRTSPPPLSRWCKTAGPKLSALVARCLAPANTADRISSLADLREEITRHSFDTPASEVNNPVRPRPFGATVLNSGPETRGLAKVAGMHELKSLLIRDVVRPLRDPEPFVRYGLTIPNGVLLFGPPGCGKTYIARQLAEELGYYFAEIIGSTIASPYIHDSVLHIRNAFETAAERAPSVLFIDEFEGLVPARSELGGNQQYKAEEVNEFLAQLNSCAERRIFVIAATNEPDKIDPAIRRTGRLDKLVYVGPPDNEARAEMLRMHLKKRPVESEMNIGALAEVLDSYSASDIKFLIDEAARLALERNVPISSDIILEAKRYVPASVNKEEEKRYRSFAQRGSS